MERRFSICFLFLMALCMWFCAYAADILEPTVSTKEAEWWLTRYDKVRYSWTDHRGHEHGVIAQSTNEVIKSGINGVQITFTSNLVWQTYKVDHGNLNPDYSYDLKDIAPGTYTNGLFYTQMTDAQKTVLWVAYTNQVIQAQLDHLAKKYADAKFDVSMDPEEYKALLMQGRTEDNLLPEEKRAVESEYRTYYDEWLRINDPEKWDFRIPLPGEGEIISEQAKKGKNGRGIITRRDLIERARARRAASREKKK